MNKQFIMAALAGFLTVGAFALSAQEQKTEPQPLTAKDNMRILAIAKSTSDPKLADNLQAFQRAGETNGVDLGYYVVEAGSSEGHFVSLSGAISQEVTTDAQGRDVVTLGRFSADDKVQFGYQENNQFYATPINVLSSDPSYFTGYKAEGFYQLDFSETPFDGKIDVLVVGEPLPGSTVTLILSLGALAIFLGYTRRKQQRADAVAQES